MFKNNLFAPLMISLLMFLSAPVDALNAKQFAELCGQSSVEANDVRKQICNAYLGGGFDAVGVMNEAAKEKNKPIFCISGEVLFDAEKISTHIVAVSKQKEFASRNAMWVLLEFVKSNSGCVE